MLEDIVTKGSVDRSVPIRFIDDTTGIPDDTVTTATGGLALWYHREGGSLVTITPATLAALSTAHTDGGIKLKSNGVYRLDVPDAAFATGANYVDYGGGATGLIGTGGRVRLINQNWETAAVVLPTITTDWLTAAGLASDAVAEIATALEGKLTATIADSIPTDGTRPSIASGIYMIAQFLFESNVSGNTLTVKKPDGTTLFTLTLNDGTTPTSITRAT